MDAFYYVTHPYWWLKSRFRNFRLRVKWAWQRRHGGIADIDWWSLNSHLARHIAEGTKKMREGGMAYPSALLDDEFDDHGKHGAELWHAILKDIEDGARAFLVLLDDPPADKEEVKQLENKWSVAKHLLLRWFDDLWD